MQYVFERLRVPHYDTKEVCSAINSSICLIDHRLGVGEAPWRTTYFGGVHLQNIDIFKDEGVGFKTSFRTPLHIQADAVRDFVLSIPLNAQSYLVQAGRQTYCEQGGCRLISTSKPFSGTVAGADNRGPYSQLLVKISGAMLRQEVPSIDDLCPLTFKIHPGAGRIMKSLIELALAEGSALSTTQAHDFSKTVIHAIANAVLDTPELVYQQARMRKSSPMRVLESAKDFIKRNLSNPTLDSTLVAAHCQVSERYLRTAFALSSVRLGAYIREQRLQQCQAELKNPALNHRSIVVIASNWGFVDAASFSRIYKARFGKAPREDRN